LRREALINARSARDASRLKLLRLINPPGAAALDRELAITDVPELPADDPASVAEHVALALRGRPELAQARLQLERGDLALLQTRNGLLPRLDLFITLGAPATPPRSARAWTSETGTSPAGLTSLPPATAPPARRAPPSSRAGRPRSPREPGPARQVDVRSAWIEAEGLREQVAATAPPPPQEAAPRPKSSGRQVDGLPVAQARATCSGRERGVSAVAGLPGPRECYRLRTPRAPRHPSQPLRAHLLRGLHPSSLRRTARRHQGSPALDTFGGPPARPPKIRSG
jgi:hypothetical protein